VPKRAIYAAAIPEPERASDATLARCRMEIEDWRKKLARGILVPLLRRRYRLAELGEGFHWQRGEKIVIQPGSKVGRFAYLGGGFEAHGPVVVGDLCMLAAGCKIVGADHLYNLVGTPTRLGFPDSERPVTVFGADVWIGQRVTIVEGLTIGTGAVIGSGSMVTRDVPPYAVVAGVPARIIKQRFAADQQAQHDALVLAAARAKVGTTPE